VLTSWAIPPERLLDNQQAIRTAWGYRRPTRGVPNEFNIDEEADEGYAQADFLDQEERG